ncbi:MAG: response regulator [Gammaproteobacteria bacterium]|nr:response regulator [Gammaproteobacteria bacterium]
MSSATMGSGSDSATLLVVDDDAEIRELIQAYLDKQGYRVICAEDGPAMDEALSSSSVDLILLDLMLPGEDGLSIAKRIKQTRNTPIIMVSAQGEEVDRIVGLEIGADDYIAKPFNPRELLARIRAVMRRNTVAEPDRQVVEFGTYRLDLDAHRLTEGKHTVPLTSGEFDLLSVLVQNPNRVLDRDRIVELLSSGQRSPFDRSVDVRVTRLRSKIEPDPSTPCYIRTVWGKGYMFCPAGPG